MIYPLLLLRVDWGNDSECDKCVWTSGLFFWIIIVSLGYIFGDSWSCCSKVRSSYTSWSGNGTDIFTYNVASRSRARRQSYQCQNINLTATGTKCCKKNCMNMILNILLNLVFEQLHWRCGTLWVFHTCLGV